MTRNKNDGWNYCAKEGCQETKLRLNGFCLKHDLEVLQSILDSPPYDGPFPNGFDAYLEENMKNPVFKAAYEKELEKIKEILTPKKA